MSLNIVTANENRMQVRPRPRWKPPEDSDVIGAGATLGLSERQSHSPGMESTLDQMIRLFAKLGVLAVKTSQITLENKHLSSSTIRRLHDLPTQMWEEVQHLPGSSMMQSLCQFVTVFDVILDEIDTYIPGSENDDGSFDDGVNFRLDASMIEIQSIIDHNINLRTERQYESIPMTITKFFQGAHHFTITGGYFGQVDHVVQDQCRWILRILIIQTGVLFS